MRLKKQVNDKNDKNAIIFINYVKDKCIVFL